MIVEGVVVFLTIAFTFLGLIFFVFDVCYIKTSVYGHSMYPTINVSVTSETEKGDVAYINRFREIRVGDIVSAKVEWEELKAIGRDSIIKRLVAQGGDRLQVEETDTSFILKNNGSVLYSVEKNNHSIAYYNRFVQNMSKFGQVATDENEQDYLIINEGEYFLMSDNWVENVVDSTKYGTLNEKQIIGGVDILLHKGENKLALITKILKHIF